MSKKTPNGKWSQNMLATIFGLSSPVLGRYINALAYPTLQTMQKFDAVLGWPIEEQVTLIPPYWEWPLQDGGSGFRGVPRDLRYSMKLRQVIREWTAANPRTIRSEDLSQHEAIPSRAGTKRLR